LFIVSHKRHSASPLQKIKSDPGGVKSVERINHPLCPKKKYSIKQLDELQDRYIEEGLDMTKEEEDMYSRCWAYAERLEGRPQWAARHYNHIGEKKDGDIIPEEEFKKMLK
jgi:hypothetical protein